MSLGPPEIVLILLVLILLFGAKKLPELARGSGRALRIFKSETKGLMDDDDEEQATTTTGSTVATAPPAQITATPVVQSPPPVTEPISSPQPTSVPTAPQPLPPTHTEQ
ncbi:MAG: Sec-independent protein translocase subunit TatA [Nocardioidaceae bacterium]